MNRGQDSLLMDIGESASPAMDGACSTEGVKLMVLSATSEQLAEHVCKLDDIDKANKGAGL